MEDFKKNIIPFVTFIAATYTILSSIIFPFTHLLIFDAKLALPINFGAHVLLTTYVVIKGVEFEIPFPTVYSKYKELREALFFVDNPDNLDVLSKRATTCLKRFLRFWIYICGVWSIYYIFLLIDKAFQGAVFQNELLSRAYFNLANTLETGFIMGGYFVLTQETYNRDQFRTPEIVRLWWIILGITAATDLVSKYLSHIGILPDVSFAFDILGGILTCTFFSLFFARLDSKFIGFNIFLIAFLFFYSSLQAIYPIFKLSVSNNAELAKQFNLEMIELFLYNIAFVAKAMLFYLLFTKRNKERLFIYFLSISILAPKFKEFHEKWTELINKQKASR